MNKIMGVASPKVGLLNVGAEEEKGQGGWNRKLMLCSKTARLISRAMLRREMRL